MEALQNFRPKLLEAYPSTAFVLGSYLERENAHLTIPFVYTGSEILHAYQRELIESRIGKVMDFYGMAERVAFASECEAGNLHVNSDYSFVEIVNESGDETTGPGYVVGTTFHNLVMPLIRYRLSDRTAWKPGSCSCGRPYPMIEGIAGKFEDVIFGAEDEPVSPSLVTFAFKGVSNIESSQVARKRAGASGRCASCLRPAIQTLMDSRLLTIYISWSRRKSRYTLNWCTRFLEQQQASIAGW